MVAFVSIINYLEEREGKIYIAGTRMRPADIGNMHVRLNSPVEWIAEQFDLTPAQIHAALAYYYDHKVEIDTQLDADDAEARRLAADSQAKIAALKSQLND